MSRRHGDHRALPPRRPHPHHRGQGLRPARLRIRDVSVRHHPAPIPGTQTSRDSGVHPRAPRPPRGQTHRVVRRSPARPGTRDEIAAKKIGCPRDAAQSRGYQAPPPAGSSACHPRASPSVRPGAEAAAQADQIAFVQSTPTGRVDHRWRRLAPSSIGYVNCRVLTPSPACRACDLFYN